MISIYPHYPCNPCEGACTKKTVKMLRWLWIPGSGYSSVELKDVLSGSVRWGTTGFNPNECWCGLFVFCNILLMFYLRAFDRFFLALGTNTLIPCAWSTHFSSWDLLRPGSWKLRSGRMNDPAWAAAEYQRLCMPWDWQHSSSPARCKGLMEHL